MTSRTLHLSTAQEFAALPDGPRKIELVGGVIYDMSPTNPPHQYAVNVLDRLLDVPSIHEKYFVQIEKAIAIPNWVGQDAPCPDIAIGTMEYELPTQESTFTVIEVSDSTYEWDHETKTPLHIAAGIPTVIVNINKKHVELYTTQSDLERPHGHVFTLDEQFTVTGVALPVSGLFWSPPVHSTE